MIIKRITSEEKTTLPSLRNRYWEIINAETEKINELLTHKLTSNIMKLNELIYAGAKLVCTKIGVTQKNTKRNLKHGWEIRLEKPIRTLQQAKMLKQRKNGKIYLDEKRKATPFKLRIQLEVINQKVLAKEVKLKKFQTESNNVDKTKYKTEHSKNN